MSVCRRAATRSRTRWTPARWSASRTNEIKNGGLMVTQIEIARQVGLDVSSVNKILNKTPGPVFRKTTIKHVFKVAKDMGYDFKRDSKPQLKRKVEFMSKVID